MSVESRIVTFGGMPLAHFIDGTGYHAYMRNDGDPSTYLSPSELQCLFQQIDCPFDFNGDYGELHLDLRAAKPDDKAKYHTVYLRGNYAAGASLVYSIVLDNMEKGVFSCFPHKDWPEEYVFRRPYYTYPIRIKRSKSVAEDTIVKALQRALAKDSDASVEMETVSTLLYYAEFDGYDLLDVRMDEEYVWLLVMSAAPKCDIGFNFDYWRIMFALGVQHYERRNELKRFTTLDLSFVKSYRICKLLEAEGVSEVDYPARKLQARIDDALNAISKDDRSGVSRMNLFG